MPNVRSLELAAQAWCSEKTSRFVMIPELAEAFAEIMDNELKLTNDCLVAERLLNAELINRLASVDKQAPAPQPCAAEGGLRAACEESLAGWKTVYSISSDLVVRDFANANIHTLEAALRAQQKEGV